MWRMPKELTCRKVKSFDGVTLNVCSNSWGGSNAPHLILLHGSPGKLSNWRYQIDEFVRRGVHVVAPDLRGYGDSGKPPSVRLEDYVKDLKVIADAVGADLRDSVIAGHSFGTMVALAYCREFDCGSLALIGPVLRLRTDFTDWFIRNLPPAIWKRLFFTNNPLTRSMYRKLFFSSRVSEEVFREFVEDMADYVASLPPHVFKYLYSMLDYDARDYAPKARLAGEAAVIVGDEDRVTPPEDARVVAQSLPKAELVVIEGAGHMVLYERPEEVNKAISKLLESLRRR